MVKPDSDDWIKTEEKSSDFDEGLGDDWESAFQAEEFMFSPGEGEGESFFLGKTGPSTAYEFTPPDDGELTGVPDLDQAAGKPSPAPPPPGASTAAPVRQQLSPSLAARWQRLREVFFGLPLVHRLALGGTTVIIALLTLVLLWPASPPMEPNAPAPAMVPPVIQTAAPGQAPPEYVRHKWEMAPFVLPIASPEPGGKTTFLEIDLSLVLVLDPGCELPEGKKLFVRDLIYGYYLEQPPDTLRRFALARGDMNRTLLAWLRERWPEAPIETVIFTRYQLS